jgi:hypothetical protein
VSFYSDLAADANALIVEFGAAASLTRVTPGVYDPATGTTTPTTQAFPCKLVVFPIEDKFKDGSLILVGDEQAFVSAVGLGDPIAGDTFPWRGSTYTVVKGEILAPAGAAVLYTLQVRK